MQRGFPFSEDLLRNLVQIKGHWNGPEAGYKGSPRYGVRQREKELRALARGFGMEARIVVHADDMRTLEERKLLGALVIEKGQGSEVVVWHGHLDTVPPHAGYARAGVDPHHLLRREGGGQIYEGLGVYDMLGGDVALLAALHQAQVHARRRIRIVMTSDEEADSLSMNGVIRSNLVADAAGFVTTEIPVGRELENKPLLLIGRNGRAVFDFTLRATSEATHRGDDRIFDPAVLRGHLQKRASRVLDQGVDIVPKPHPRHPHGLMPPSHVWIDDLGTVDPQAMTTPTEHNFAVEVMWSNSGMRIGDLERFLREEFRRILGDDHFYLRPRKRETPYIEPWLEDSQSGFVQKMHHMLQRFDSSAQLAGGGAVAEDGMLVLAHGKPGCTVPLKGGNPHKLGEWVDMQYAEHVVIPFLRAVAEDPEPFNPDQR